MPTTLMPSDRRVRRIRLKAPSHELARHVAIVLEDALRVSTLPAADEGRLVLIRRLDLGRVPADASSPALALQLGEHCRALSLAHVDPGTTALTEADAVAFADRAEAIVCLARHCARHASAPEWFWPLVVPGWRHDLPPRAAWRVLLRAALAEPAAPVIAAELVRTAADAGRLVELAEALTLDDIPALYAACAWLPPSAPEEPVPDASRDGGNRRQEPSPSREWLRMLLPDFRRHRPALRCCPRPVAAWLAAALAVGAQPALAANARLATFMSAWLEDILGSPGHATPAGPVPPQSENLVVRREAPPLPESDSDLAPDPARDLDDRGVAKASPASAPRTGGTPGTSTGAAGPPPPAGVSRPPAAAPTFRPHKAEESPAAEPVVSPWTALPRRESTAGGGLLFVVPVLERLDFPAWLRERPERLEEGLGEDLLRTIGQRVGLHPDDALMRVLGTRDEGSLGPATGGPHLATASLTPVVDGALAGTGGGDPSHDRSHRRRWVQAVRRYCRLDVRMGLASLIRRPAQLRASRTHLEIFFELPQVDLRLRRAGLDLDPGWVPWLGKVIRFHYLDPED